MKNPIFQKTPNSNRVSRGGSWSLGPDNLRSAGRISGTPSIRGNVFGFRIFRTKVES